MKKPLRFKKGQILIIGIIFMAVILMFSSTIFSKVSYFINFGFKSLEKQQAIHAAEAGIDYAARTLYLDSTYLGTAATPIKVGSTGEFEISVATPFPNIKTVTAIGYIPAKSNYRSKQTIQVNLFPTSTSAPGGFGGPLSSFPIGPNDIVNTPNGGHSLIGGPFCNDDYDINGKPNTYYINYGASYNISITRMPNDSPFGKGQAVAMDDTPNSILYIIGTRSSHSCTNSGNSDVWTARFNGSWLIASWTPTTPLPQPYSPTGPLGARSLRNYAAAYVAVGNFTEPNKKYLYLLGGVGGYCPDDGGSPTEDQPCQPFPDPPILRARPNDYLTGALNPWQAYSPSDPDDVLNEGFQDTSALVYNNKLYLIGGRGTNRVVYAPIKGPADADPGGLGAFESNPNRLPDKISHTGVVATNGYVYVMGGRKNYFYNASGVKYSMTRISDVYSAKIESNGELGPFNLLPNRLPTMAESGGTFVSPDYSDFFGKSYIYYIGGVTGTSNPYGPADVLSGCWRTKAFSNGTTEPWSPCDLPAPSSYSGYAYSGWRLDKSTLHLK